MKIPDDILLILSRCRQDGTHELYSQTALPVVNNDNCENDDEDEGCHTCISWEDWEDEADCVPCMAKMHRAYVMNTIFIQTNPKMMI